MTILKPFEKVSDKTGLAILCGWLTFIIGYWAIYSQGDVKLFPSISQVAHGFSDLWEQGLMTHIFSSLYLCFKSLLIAVTISLLVVYSSPMPLIKPISNAISKLRYLPLTGISFYISMVVHDGRSIQVWILVLFMSTFLVTSLLSMIKNIPEEEFDHARTLGCNRWEVLWEVVIKGRLDYVIEAVRQNFAIMYFALVMVESILAASGGIGFLIKNSDKFMNHGRIVALQILLLFIGIGLDKIFSASRRLSFRYSKF